ncbi:MAG: RuBisCO accumulation factor 1 [Thermostichus sp. DRC_bins_24]
MSQYEPENPAVGEDPETLLTRLRRKEGSWLDWAEACQALQRQNMTPQAIFEATGFEPIHQNQIIVGAQVYQGMAKTGASPAVLEYFGRKGSDILYELRILSQKDRLRVAELILSRNLNADDAHEIARAVKNYAQLQQLPEGFTDHPGDAVAYQAWKTARQTRDVQERTRAIGRAFQYVHSDEARRHIEQLLSTVAASSAGGLQRKRLPKLSVFRLEEDLPRLLPVVGSLPLPTAVWEQLPASEPQGPFRWVNSPAQQTWVALPSWSVIQNAGDPVVLQVENAFLGSLLGLQVPTGEEQDPVLLVIDRAVREWPEASGPSSQTAGFFVVDRGGSLMVEWLEEPSQSSLLGQVLMAVRPPRILDEVVAQDPWQLEE